MLHLLADENFNGDIVRGVLLSQPDFDLVRVQDVGLSGVGDDDVLAWAAEQNRIVITHDRATMPNYAFERLLAGVSLPGLFVVNDRLLVSEAISELILMADCSEQGEWEGRVIYLPL